MKTVAAAAVILLCTLTLQAQSVRPPISPADTITQEELRQHVCFLVSDFLGSRRPDDAGYAIAKAPMVVIGTANGVIAARREARP